MTPEPGVPAGLAVETAALRRLRPAPGGWCAAVDRAEELIAPGWEAVHGNGSRDDAAGYRTAGTVALVVHVLSRASGCRPALVDRCSVLDALSGEEDVEREPADLARVLRRGLAEAGHTDAEGDPIARLHHRLVAREPFALDDVPVALTGGLTRWSSALAGAARRARRALGDGTARDGGAVRV
jgi:hypothetical protein